MACHVRRATSHLGDARFAMRFAANMAGHVPTNTVS